MINLYFDCMPCVMRLKMGEKKDSRDVGDGREDWAIARPGFARSVNPLSTRGGRLSKKKKNKCPPRFRYLPMSMKKKVFLINLYHQVRSRGNVYRKCQVVSSHFILQTQKNRFPFLGAMNKLRADINLEIKM